MTPNHPESADYQNDASGIRSMRRSAQWVRPLGDWLLRLSVVVVAISAVFIAVEQNHQTSIKRTEACYSRVAALAQIALVDVTASASTKANPGLRFLECDRISGVAP